MKHYHREQDKRGEKDAVAVRKERVRHVKQGRMGWKERRDNGKCVNSANHEQSFHGKWEIVVNSLILSL